MKTKIFIFALVLLGLFSAAQVTTYGTVIFAHNGTTVNQANVSMYNYSGGGSQQVKTLQNTTLTNASGWFNITYEDSSIMLEFKVTWTNSTGAVQYISNALPTMPFSEINNTLTTIQNYNISIGLVPAATINLSAVNNSGGSTGFAYSLRDLSYGMEVSSNSSVSPLTNVTITVVANKNYSLSVWQSGNMIGVNQGITIVPITYIISSYNLTNTLVNGTHTLQMNFTQSLANVSGNVSIIGNSSAVSFQAGFFPADVIGTEWIIHYGSGRTPFTVGSSGNYIDTWNGNYSLAIPTGTQATNYVLFITANDSSNYFGAFQNFTMTTLGTNYPSNLNLTLRHMNGTFANTLGMNFGNDVNSSKVIFYLNSSTGSIINQSGGTELLFNVTAPASWNGPVKYTMMVRANDSGAFVVPLINDSVNVSLKVFSMGAAPKETTINMTTLTNTTYINLPGSAMQAGSGGGVLGNLNVTFYYSNSTCDIPEAPSICAVATMELNSTAGMIDSSFHPLAFTLAGKNISIRIFHISSGAMVKYYNVNLIASGPPDASMDTSATESSSGSSFSGFQRFGSMGPKVFDNVSVALPYSDTELVDTQTINIVLSKLYDENWNQIWNSTASSYGNNVGANVPAYYQDYYNFSKIFNESNKLPCSTSTQTSTCYVNTGSNRIWITVPHFSGGGYGYDGTAYTAPATLPSSSDESTEITPTTSFDCTTKLLTVIVSTKVNGGTIKLIDKTNFQGTVIAKVEDGKAVFTLSKSGTYKLAEDNLPSGYSLKETETSVDLTTCESPGLECTTSSDCSSTEQCTANECVAVTGTCGYAASNAWVSYECCTDSDCAEGFECTANVCEETGGVPDFVDELLEQAAIDAIAEATSTIETAKAAGKYTVDAEAKLAEAQAAFDASNYDLAESLALESIELIKELQAEETPEEDQTLDETTTEDSKEDKGADYSMVLYLIGAIIVLFLLYKFVLKGGKGYRK